MDGNMPVILFNIIGSHEYSGEALELAVEKHETTPFTREIGVWDNLTMPIVL